MRDRFGYVVLGLCAAGTLVGVACVNSARAAQRQAHSFEALERGRGGGGPKSQAALRLPPAAAAAAAPR